MGIIQRQGIKNSIVSFAGVLVGGISLIFIYPLEDEMYGLAQFVYSMAILLTPFATFGILPSIVKFYPSFKTLDNKNEGYLSLVLVSLIVGIGMFLGLLYLFEPFAMKGLEYLNFNVGLFEKYKGVILILLVLLTFIHAFQNYAQNYKRIVVPQILNGFAFKIVLPILVLLFFWKWIDESIYLSLILLFFSLVLVGMIWYTKRQNQLSLSKINLPLFKTRKTELLGYSLFSSLTSVGNVLAFRIDTVMVAAMVSLEGTGIYAKILFIASVIDIPVRSIIRIASPIISEKFDVNNLKDVETIYKKSSLNGLLIGGLIFLLIWFSIEDLFKFSGRPESFLDGKMIFLALAIGKLIDIATSVNGHIIIYSKYYKYNLIFILLLSCANILFNYFYIDLYGVRGAAIATCISLAIFNVVKLFFVHNRFKINPFTIDTLKVLALMCFVFGIAYFIPSTDSFLLNMILKSSIILILYIPLMIKLKISKELNDMIFGLVARFKS